MTLTLAGGYGTQPRIESSVKWNDVSFDLRYSATDHSIAECGFGDWCEPGVTATLQIDLWD